MADIRIEKKKPVWPWLLLIIILAIVAFLYFYGSTDTEDMDDMEPGEIEEVTYISTQQQLYSNKDHII
jgi:hypothetical protein